MLKQIANSHLKSWKPESLSIVKLLKEFEQQSIETLESKKKLGHYDDLITYAENQQSLAIYV